jgi:hypothetical protein
MTPPLGATEVLRERGRLEFVAQKIAERARSHARLEPADAEALFQRVRSRVLDLLDAWSMIAKEYDDDGVRLQYQSEAGGARPLLHDFLDPELKKLNPRHRKFRANRSMRDVEPSVNIVIKTLDGFAVTEDGE